MFEPVFSTSSASSSKRKHIFNGHCTTKFITLYFRKSWSTRAFNILFHIVCQDSVGLLSALLMCREARTRTQQSLRFWEFSAPENLLENSSASHYNDACKPVSVCELRRIENNGPPQSGALLFGAPRPERPRRPCQPCRRRPARRRPIGSVPSRRASARPTRIRRRGCRLPDAYNAHLRV